MDQPQDPKLIGRLSAFAETALLLVAGSLVAGAIARETGLGQRDARDELLYGEAGPQWLAAASTEAQWLILRFGLTLLAAWLICWWIGGPTRKLAGLSRGGRSLGDLIGFGVVMGVLLAAPPFGLRVLNEMYAIGEGTPFWRLMAESEWTLEFWLFMAASSFVLVPIVEELFFRSYMLGRYRMHFTAGGAVLLSAAVFWVSHGQYIQADLNLIINSAMAFITAAILAWSVVRTGSVLPAIIAHMIFNLPMSQPFLIGVVVLRTSAGRRAVETHRRRGCGFFPHVGVHAGVDFPRRHHRDAGRGGVRHPRLRAGVAAAGGRLRAAGALGVDPPRAVGAAGITGFHNALRGLAA